MIRHATPAAALTAFLLALSTVAAGSAPRDVDAPDPTARPGPGAAPARMRQPADATPAVHAAGRTDDRAEDRTADRTGDRHRVYLPYAERYGGERFVGIAFDPRSLQTFEADLAWHQAAAETHYAIVHVPAVWAALEFEDLQRLFDIVVANGSTPLVVWEPWVGLAGGVGPRHCQRDYALEHILSGRFDPYVRRFARAAAEWGHAFLLDFGHEMNIDQAAWSGTCNGGARGGPERFVRTYRHLHGLFLEEGATNVRWVWSPNAESFPKAPWNDAEAYYPGDDVVDWIGTNAFNWGASSDYTGRRFLSLEDNSGPLLDRMAALHPDKPQIVIEAGSVDGDGGRRAEWVAAALEAVARRPKVRAIVYYSHDQPGYLDGNDYDFRLDRDPAARAAIRDGVRRLGFSQHLYEGRDSTPPRHPKGRGALLGVGLDHPRDIYAADALAPPDRTHAYTLFYADFSQSWRAYRELFLWLTADRVPVVVWQPTGVTLDALGAGARDAYLAAWADGLAALDREVLLVFAPEPNNGLSGRPWTGAMNGGADGGPERYVAAWRRARGIFRAAGATRVRWVWMPYYQDAMPGEHYAFFPAWARPDRSWNHMARYDPGGDVVDWVGVAAINQGNDAAAGTYWTPPATFFERALSVAAARHPTKPQLAQLTSVEDPADPARKAAWIAAAYAHLESETLVRAVVWQHAYGDGWRIDSSPAAAAAYRRAVGGVYYGSLR